MKRVPLRILLSVAWVAYATPVSGKQLEQGGTPSSFGSGVLPDVPSIALQPVEHWPADDTGQRPGPLRFGDLIEVDLNMQESGEWVQLADGTLVWRLRLVSPGALSLSLVFQTFRVPPEGSLFVYDDSRTVVRGAYTNRNHNWDERFAIQPVAGHALTLEYNQPLGAASTGEIRLSGVVHDFLGVTTTPTSNVEAPPCQIDVNCPQGDPWRDQVNAVVQIQTNQFLCTGALINNTARNGDQLFISAFHCGDMNNSIFRFNYQTSGCRTGPPGNQTVQGSVELVTNATPNDIRLVRITRPIPPRYGAHFVGWDRSGEVPVSTVGIHHPNSLRKRINVDSDPPTIGGFQQQNWIVDEWDFGHLEPGSSGSPLYSQEGRYVGRGYGTVSTCTVSFPSTYRRFVSEWHLIQDYLDPMETGEVNIAGFDPFPTRIDTATPTVVEALRPGTRQDLSVLGQNFPPFAKVQIDGVFLEPESYTVVDENEITIDLPQLTALGEHSLIVRDGSDTDSIGFRVKEAASPILQFANGDWLTPIAPLAEVELVMAGGVGSLQWVFFSFSNMPSVDPLITLDIGDGFRDLHLGGVYFIPKAGWVLDHLSVPAGFAMETPVFAQALGLSDTGLRVSNVQAAMITVR